MLFSLGALFPLLSVRFSVSLPLIWALGVVHEVYNNFKKNLKNSLGEFVIVVEEDIMSKKKLLYELTPDIIEVMNKLLGKFSLTDTVEIVHRIGNIAKKEIYKKALDIQNEK